jgi:hypothetical protein
MIKLRFAIAAGFAVAVFASHTACTSKPAGATPNALIPPLMLPYPASWSGGAERGNGAQVPMEDFLPADFIDNPESTQAGLIRGIPADKVRLYVHTRAAGQFIPPASGIGPITDDPQHPYLSNSLNRSLGTTSTARIADLNNAAGKNLLPWAAEALKKQNDLVHAGKNLEPRVQRCWELGIPAFNEVRHPMYFIQTPEEVVIYMGKYVRHIYMNVPHSKDVTPSWYGESVGHYEGDTLVVDTIGQNDKTFIDAYRTPHTTQMRVIERFRVISDGKGLDTTFTVEDPGTFKQPWSARRPRYLLSYRPLVDMDRICAAGGEDVFNLGLEPMQKSVKPPF